MLTSFTFLLNSIYLNSREKIESSTILWDGGSTIHINGLIICGIRTLLAPSMYDSIIQGIKKGGKGGKMTYPSKDTNLLLMI